MADVEDKYCANSPSVSGEGGFPCQGESGSEHAGDDRLLIEVNSFEMRIAVLGGGELRELHLARPQADSWVGNVYVGKVQRVEPGLQAAFLDVGLPRLGLLKLDDVGIDAARNAVPGRSAAADGDALRQEQRILVQVTKDPTQSKGVRLTANIGIAGRYLVLMPFTAGVAVSRRIDDEAMRARLKDLAEAACGERCGCIVRTAAKAASAAQIEADLEYLLRCWHDIQRHAAAVAAPALVRQEMPTLLRAVRDLAGSAISDIVVDDAATLRRLHSAAAHWLPELRGSMRCHEGALPLFDAYGVESAIARLHRSSVPLAGGGYLVIEHTEAMTTIDVNSGAGGAASMERTAFETNRQAAAAIPGQLRLRNIGGIVVVDFIDMADAAHQDEVLAVLRCAAAADPAPFRASGFSPLGLVEISRRRARTSLLRQVCERCPACAGRGYMKTPQSVCYDMFRSLRRRYGEAAGGDEVVVRVAQDVAARLGGEESTYLAELSRELRRPIRVQPVDGYRIDRFDLA